MKTCLRLTLFICLLLPPTLTIAARDTVRVASPCHEGDAFTIIIPFRLSPPDIDTVFYRWYCSGEPIAGAEGVATSQSLSIDYTIPANSDHRGDVGFYFEYRLDDCCDEWSRSPVYLIAFEEWGAGDCRLRVGVIVGMGIMDCGLDSGSVSGLGILGCSLQAGIIGGGSAPDFPSCSLVAGGIEGAGFSSCGLAAGGIRGEGIKGCSLAAGTIGGGRRE